MSLERPALVLLHGAGLSHRSFELQRETLGRDFRCVVPDLVEHGQTPGLFTMERALAQVTDLVRALPERRAHWVGVSLGGAVVLEVLRVAPELAITAMVLGTSGTLAPGWGRLMRWTAGMTRFMPASWLVNTTLAEHGIEAHRALVEDDLRRALDPDFNRRVADALMQHRPPERAPVPTLILAGTRETSMARRAAQALGVSVRGARSGLLQGVGHLAPLEAPALFDAAVRAWTKGEMPDAVIPFADR